MEEHKVHVSRNGSLLGVYDFDQLGDMLERGQLQKTDHYYDDATAAWIPLAEWKEAGGLANFKHTSEKPASEDGSASGSRRRGGKSSRAKKKGAQTAVFGWVACLFALVVAAGIFAYAATLHERIKAANDEITSLKAINDNLKRENQLMTEITPSDRVRAIITYEPSANQVAIMSGATVGLYRRKDVEAALAGAVGEEAVSNMEGFEKGIEKLKSAISSPLQITLTDSNGRVDLPVPEPGDYVLVASAGKSTPSGTERFLWLMGFQASGQPSSLILLNEKNASSLRKPHFSIVDVPPMSSGNALP
jgi:hypothetical protein